LSSSAAAEYVRATLSPDADDGFCDACHEFTGGNPQLLRELLNAIVVESVEPFAASVPSLQELAGQVGRRTVTVRLSRLPSEATKLAQAVAILGEDVDPYEAAAHAELDEEAALRATDDLVRVEILRPQPLLGFVHPLVRGAVYQSLTPLQRNQGHARAATLLEESGAEPDRVAAQLLLVPPALVPSEDGSHVVALLRDAARGARRRGATEVAIAYLRRALAEPPAQTERAELLLELGSAESLVDGVAAVEHFREAHSILQDPIARARTAFLIGRLLFFLRPQEAPPVLKQALDELEEADDELAGFLEAALIAFALFEKQLYPEALRRLERARSLPDEMTTPERWLLALLTYHDARTNVPAARVVELARRVLASRPVLPGEPSPRPWVVTCQLLSLADVDEAVTIFDTMLAHARRHGGMLDVALAQLFRAEMFIFRGDLPEAVAEGLEARQTYEAWGTAPHFLALVAAFLADALMDQGKLKEAAAAMARVDVAVSDSSLLHAIQLSSARLRLLTGDLLGGVEETRDAGRRFEEVGGRNPAFVPWRSQAALALLELGEQDEARRLAAEELELAQTWGAPRALGAALRAAGLTEGGSEGLAKLEEAVAVLEDSPAKLEHAKARIELGAALRRANRRSQAREHLSRGLELATICGATPLAERAETELLATGARPRRISLSGVESLTPSERRVAEMAAKGPTNREIAQALFVTPKTVEVHLSSAYRKLRISSRSQLAAALATAYPAG
jgi:DNA-binding CsgD family transcriptional regulator/tetratricopeptide (TPR) repeat protein